MKNKRPYPHFTRCIHFFLCILIFSSCSFRAINRSTGIVYFKADTVRHIAQQKLNVYAPKKTAKKNKVLIFIHGGNWSSDSRLKYGPFGTGMAKRGIVAVVIDYPLSPKVSYNEMAFASASSVKWVKEHIAAYGGDPNQIFISGHSAGGHLAALVSLDNEYFKSLHIANPIKGTILIDAAGLDIYAYMKQQVFREVPTYLKTFTADTATWKKASPVNHLHKGMPPFLIYQGGRTFPFIKETNAIFLSELVPLAPSTKYEIIEDKGHFGMMLQYLYPWSKRYDEVIAFMKGVK